MSMSMDNVPTLGSALLRGDEQSRSQVNSLLLGLIQSSTSSLDNACWSRDEARRRGGKRRQRKTTVDKKDRKRRWKEEEGYEEEEVEVETKKRHNKQPEEVRRVDRNKSAGKQTHKKTQQESKKMKVEMQITTEPEVQVQERSVVEIRRTASEEVFVPMLPTADVYDYFDYHYYPQSAYSTPLPSPHTRSTPSSPFASPFLSCETRSSIHVPSASFSYAPSTVVPLPLVPSISSFGVPCPIDAIWALPSRPSTPTLDYCTQLLLQ
jgi:hypothetical protein